MGEIKSINVSNLRPHPQNPRKALGDITELTESVRANGVLQNLTVVPEGENYKIVIGHRRAAAAKAAGLEAVPCIVAELTEKEQLRIMLMENMQRSDLTVLEQAEGFQLMMDLGESIKDLAKDSGFSQATIKNRLKIAALPKQKVQKGLDQGATIEDFIALEKVENPEAKEKLLSIIGTARFRSDLSYELELQKVRKNLYKKSETLKEWANEITSEERDYNMHRYYSTYGAAADVPTEKPEEGEYFFEMPRHFTPYSSISIYKLCDGAVEEAEETEEKKAARLFREEAEICRAMAEGLKEYRVNLWKGFIESKSEKELEKDKESILACLPYLFDGNADADDTARIMGLKGKDKDNYLHTFTESEPLRQKIAKEPLKGVLLALISSWEVTIAGFITSYGRGERMPSPQLEGIGKDFYDVLAKLGYTLSEDEQEVLAGTHEMFNAYKKWSKENETN